MSLAATAQIAIALLIFSLSPYLISNAVYSWMGKKLLQDVSHFFSEDSLEVSIPGNTFISDYRLAGELKGQPVDYVLQTNGPPSVVQLKQTTVYKRRLAAIQASTKKF
jgi:hypothetical protein